MWETWIVEGLEDGSQFAMITKIHHCMIDGASGVDLANIQMSTSPEPRALPTPPLFRPRAAPRRLELFLDETRRTLGIPASIVRDFSRFVNETDDLRDDISMRATAVIRTLGMGTDRDETPINGKLGPHRRFEWLSCLPR